jgi:hypothetical protein
VAIPTLAVVGTDGERLQIFDRSQTATQQTTSERSSELEAHAELALVGADGSKAMARLLVMVSYLFLARSQRAIREEIPYLDQDFTVCRIPPGNGGVDLELGVFDHRKDGFWISCSGLE